MPTSWETDTRTGKTRKVGGRGGLESAPLSRTAPASPTKPKPEAKPWWWYLTPAGISNEARFRAKQVQDFNGDWVPAGNVGVMPLYRNRRTGRLGGLGETPVGRQIGHAGLVKAPVDAALAGVNLAQRVLSGQPLKPRDPESTPIGRALVAFEQNAATAMGARRREQMTPDQKGWFSDLPAGFAMNAALAPLTPALPVAVGGAGLAGKALRWPLNLGIDAAVGGLFVDQTQGNSGDLLKSMGVPGAGALAVQPGKDDRISAALKGIPGDMLIGGGIGGTLSGVLKLAEVAPNVARNLRERRLKTEAQAAREQTVNNGIQQVDTDTGEYGFTQQAQTPPPKTYKQAAEQLLGPETQPAPAAAAPAAAAPEVASNPMTAEGPVMGGNLPEQADPAVDPRYPEELPEVDVAAMGVNRLDDEALKALDQVDGPVLPQMEQYVAQQAAPEPDPMVSTATTAAPTENLAEPVTPYADQWQALSNAELLTVAHPASSPDLFGAIQGLTGREFEQFTRQDVIDGLSLLQEQGKTVIPNRLKEGQTLMPVGDIAVDPQRLQFKDGVDAQGRQRGNSLEGVTQWNPDAEGVIQVWTDPADGKAYVVNGHNRLAAAKGLGIPTLRVEELLAAKPEQARAQGAISNISAGGGTVFDAAKFLRDSGVTDPARLQQMGIPLDSGFGAQGLALSRLPGNIFQDAVDGRLPVGKAVSLGGSGLDEVQMQAAYKGLQGQDLTDGEFNEVVQQAASAPVIEGSQVDLFGNTETMSLMVTKGKLANAIRRGLVTDKNLFKKVGKNAGRLQEGGNQIDVAGSKQVAMSAQEVLGEFDRTKYAAETPISQMLNDGAIEIANGARADVIANRIKRQLAETASQTPGNPEPASQAAAQAMEPQDLTAQEREAMKARIVQKAVANGEVRPSATPITATPDAPKDLTNAEALSADEQRLAAEYAARDAAVAQEVARAERQATGYYDKSFEEKKASGIAEGWAPAPRRAAFAFPSDLDKSAPRYGMAQVQFASDLDRAAYMLRNSAKKSKGEDRLIRALEAAGYDIPAVRAHGEAVKDALKGIVTEQTGSARAPQSAMALQVPDQGFKAAGAPAAPAQPPSVPGAEPVTLLERVAYAKEQMVAATARGDGAAAVTWGQELRLLERQRIAKAQSILSTSQQDMFGVGQYDTSTPLLNEPPAAENAGDPIRVKAEVAPPKVADIYENLANALVESDRKTFRQVDRLRGLTQRAIKELESGDPTRALKEASVFGERRVAELQGQIESIKQRAIEEGC